MIDSIKTRFWAPRFPMLCLVLVALFNGLAAWSVPDLSPSSIGFDKRALEAREGDTAELVLSVDPLPQSDIEIGIQWDGPVYGTVWQFGAHRDMREAANGGFVLRIPEGRRSITLPVEFIDDGVEKTQPDLIKVNLVRLTRHTEPGEFSQVSIHLLDPYVPPVIQIAEGAKLHVQEGGTLSVPIIASGKVELPLSIPISLPGAAKDVQVGSGKTVRFGEGMNQSIVDLSAIEDRLYEGDEKFFIRLEEGERYVLGEQRELEVLIADGDQPPVFKIRAIQAVFGHDEAVIVKMRASVPSAKEKRVDFTLHNISDLPDPILPPDKKVGYFVIPSGEDAVDTTVLDTSVAWPQGNHQLAARIDPKLVDREGDETASFTVTHTPAALTPSEAALDEGEGSLKKVTVQLPEGTQAAKKIDLRLRFSGNATYGDDYELVGGLGNALEKVTDGVWECPLTIPEGQRQVSFQLRAVDDAAYEGREPERIEIEITEASAGIDRRHNVSLLSIRDNEQAPQLAIEWGGNEKLKEGEAGTVILSIPETAQVEVPIEGMLQLSGKAKEGKHFKIASKKFTIMAGEKSDSLTLRATDDREPDRNIPPHKSLNIGVEKQGLKNALAPQRDLHLYIVDDDKWEGGTEVLILVAMTDAWNDTKIREQISSALQLLAEQEDFDLIGGGVQWFDAKNPATLRDWPQVGFPNVQTFFKQLDTGAILGGAQTIEVSVAKKRKGHRFVLLLMYPLVEKSNQVVGEARFKRPGKDNKDKQKDKQEVQNRRVLIVGRDNEIIGELLQDIGEYSKKQPARTGPTAKDLKQTINNQIMELKPKNNGAN